MLNKRFFSIYSIVDNGFLCFIISIIYGIKKLQNLLLLKFNFILVQKVDDRIYDNLLNKKRKKNYVLLGERS